MVERGSEIASSVEVVGTDGHEGRGVQATSRRALLRRAVIAVPIGPLEERPFRLLFAGTAVSTLGDRLVPVALAFAVLGLTNSATDLALVLGAQTGTFVCFVLLGGVFADRLPRQLLMLGSDVIRAGSEAAVAVLLLTGTARIWELIALQAVFGASDAFFQPAATGLVPRTVRPENLQRANALLRLTRGTSAIVGPAIAGILVATIGAGWAFVGDAGSFVISAWCLALLRLPKGDRPQGQRLWSELSSGWREFRGRTWIWVSVTYFAFFQGVVLTAYLVLGPLVAKDSLGGASAWATILSSAGAGSLVGSLVAFRFRPRRPLRACIVLMALWAPVLILLAMAAPVPFLAVAAFVATFGIAEASIFWDTALQENVAPDLLSRMSSYDWLGSVAFTPLGFALMGALGAAIGAHTTLWLAAISLAVSTLLVLRVPAISTVGRSVARD